MAVSLSAGLLETVLITTIWKNQPEQSRRVDQLGRRWLPVLFAIMAGLLLVV